MSNVQDNVAHTCSYSCDRPQCIKAQRDELAAAAAQEAVAKVGSDHFRSIVDWLGPIPPPNTLLYAAPITAAPGIDLTPLWRLSDEWLKALGVRGLGNEEKRLRWALAKELRDALSLIDTSPKGTTLNEQFGNAEGLGSASHYRQVLERIATQGPHYGPDGTRETWKHWSDIARDALVDSPKGGSEARDEIVSAAVAWWHEEMQHGDGNDRDAPGHSHEKAGIWDSDNGELAGKPCARCSLWYRLRNAVRAVQASDAEVRP